MNNEPIDVRDRDGEGGLEAALDIAWGLLHLFVVLPLTWIYETWTEHRARKG